MSDNRRVTRFVHIRVPDSTSAEQMQIIVQGYKETWTMNPELSYGVIDIDVDRPYTVSASHADSLHAVYDELRQLADAAALAVRSALPNSDPAVVVSSERMVVSVEHVVDNNIVTQYTDEHSAAPSSSPMRTIFHFSVPKDMSPDEMMVQVLDVWARDEHPPFPCDILRLAPGDNLVINSLPEGQDLDDAIQLIGNVLNNPDSNTALVTREGLTLQRCGSHHE